MKTVAFFVVVLFSFQLARANTILVNDSTRNGDFETGVGSPWGGLTVSQDNLFADHGSWFATLAANAVGSTARSDGFQFLPIDVRDGATVNLTFRARIPASSAFSSITASLSDASFDMAVRQVLEQPALSGLQWQTYSYQFTLPPTWSSSGNSKLSIQLTKSLATSGQLYSGYIDAVTLTQVPEPSVMSLGLSIAMLTLFKRRLAREM